MPSNPTQNQFIYFNLPHIVNQKEMFNPSKFLSPQQRVPPYATPNSTHRIIIQKSQDKSKSRWNEKMSIPAVLYEKFNVPVPGAGKGSSGKKQGTQLPQSLIEYMKRAYENCNDDSQRRQMEAELRKIVSEKKTWEREPIPAISKPQIKRAQIEPSFTSSSTIIKKEKISMKLKQLDQFQEKPSKAKMKVSKMLEKFQEKLNKKHQPQQENNKQDRKMFIGFKNEPQPKPGFAGLKPSKFNPPFPTPFPGKSTQKPASNSYNPKILNIGDKPTESSCNPRKQPEPKVSRTKPATVKEKKAQMQKSKGSGNQMLKRFTEFNQLKAEAVKVVVESEDQIDDIPIVGKSTSMEKPYLRITGRADPEIVRPEAVLRKVLEFILKKYRNGASYQYIHQQFKSLRQDLTVQHIRNDLTVKAYQENLKISLFENDTQTFKQYLSNLWQLYRQGIYDKKNARDSHISYLLLTQVMEERYKDLQYTLTLVDSSTLLNPEVKDALKLKRAFMMGNYRAFFDFYNDHDGICHYLLNQFIDRVRMNCLLMICKTFGQKIPLSQLAETINEDEDLLQGMITKEGGRIENGWFYLKDSAEKLAKSQLLMVKKARVTYN